MMRQAYILFALVVVFAWGFLIGELTETAPDCPEPAPHGATVPEPQPHNALLSWPVERPACYLEGFDVVCRDPHCTWDGSAVKCSYAGNGWTLVSRRY